jgi:hypothetical protein
MAAATSRFRPATDRPVAAPVGAGDDDRSRAPEEPLDLLLGQLLRMMARPLSRLGISADARRAPGCDLATLSPRRSRLPSVDHGTSSTLLARSGRRPRRTLSSISRGRDVKHQPRQDSGLLRDAVRTFSTGSSARLRRAVRHSCGRRSAPSSPHLPASTRAQPAHESVQTHPEHCRASRRHPPARPHRRR